MEVLAYELRKIEGVPEGAGLNKVDGYRNILEDWRRKHDLVERTISEDGFSLVGEYDRRVDVVIGDGKAYYPNVVNDENIAGIEELRPIVGMTPGTSGLTTLVGNPVSIGGGASLILMGVVNGGLRLSDKLREDNTMSRRDLFKTTTQVGAISAVVFGVLGGTSSLVTQGEYIEGRENAEFIDDVVGQVYQE